MIASAGLFKIEIKLPSRLATTRSAFELSPNTPYYSGADSAYNSNNDPNYFARRLSDGRLIDFRRLISAMRIINHGGPLSLDEDFLLVIMQRKTLNEEPYSQTSAIYKQLSTTAQIFVNQLNKTKDRCLCSLSNDTTNPDAAFKLAEDFHKYLVSFKDNLQKLSSMLESSEPSTEAGQAWKKDTLALCKKYTPYCEAVEEIFSTELGPSEDLIASLETGLESKTTRLSGGVTKVGIELKSPQKLVVNGARSLWLAIERLVSNAFHAITELGLDAKPKVEIKQDANGSTRISIENPAKLKKPGEKLIMLCQPAADSINPWKNEYGGLSLPTVAAIVKRLGGEMLAKYTSPEGQVTEHQFC